MPGVFDLSSSRPKVFSPDGEPGAQSSLGCAAFDVASWGERGDKNNARCTPPTPSLACVPACPAPSFFFLGVEKKKRTRYLCVGVPRACLKRESDASLPRKHVGNWPFRMGDGYRRHPKSARGCGTKTRTLSRRGILNPATIRLTDGKPAGARGFLWCGVVRYGIWCVSPCTTSRIHGDRMPNLQGRGAGSEVPLMSCMQ